MLWRSEGSVVLKTARRRLRPDPYWNDNRLKMGYITAQIIFWLGLGTLAYVYVGYPLLVYFVSRVFPKTTARGEIEPTVTVLITAFNEEAALREKIENTLAINYPSAKLEILVASDGST